MNTTFHLRKDNIYEPFPAPVCKPSRLIGAAMLPGMRGRPGPTGPVGPMGPPGDLSFVTTDHTLTGDGTASDPLSNPGVDGGYY